MYVWRMSYAYCHYSLAYMSEKGMKMYVHEGVVRCQEAANAEDGRCWKSRRELGWLNTVKLLKENL